MKRILTVIIFGAALANAQAQADRWLRLSSANSRNNVYIDTETLQRTSELVTVWEKFTESSGVFSLMRTEIRRNHQSRVTAYYKYSASGDLLQHLTTPTEWGDVPPGSLQETVNQYFFPGDPPAPKAQGSALELISDPMGVDFRPYLTQILATIRRNWFAATPGDLNGLEKVSLLFSIARDGGIVKVTWGSQSGADSLDRAAVAALAASNPFPPLPTEFKGDRIVLRLNFTYGMRDSATKDGIKL
jgi:hypothetical protein